MPRSARPYSARRYTGSRATVASGIPADGPLISGGIALVCIAAALLGLSSWFGLPGVSGVWGSRYWRGPVEPASADLIHGTPLCISSQSGRLTAQAWSRRPAEGGAQAGLAHLPEVDLHPVDQRHRDLVPVLAQVLRRGGDVAFLPADPEVARHPFDHRPRVVAQVAARPAQQRDAVHTGRPGYGARRSGRGGSGSRLCGRSAGRGCPGLGCCGLGSGATLAYFSLSSMTLVASTQARRSATKRIM